MQCILHYVVMLQHSSWSKSLICDWAVWNTKLSSRDLIYCNTTVWCMLVLLVSNFQLCLGSLVHGIIVLVKSKGYVGFCRFSYLIGFIKSLWTLGFMLLHLSETKTPFLCSGVQNLARNINKWVNHLSHFQLTKVTTNGTWSLLFIQSPVKHQLLTSKGVLLCSCWWVQLI